MDNAVKKYIAMFYFDQISYEKRQTFDYFTMHLYGLSFKGLRPGLTIVLGLNHLVPLKSTLYVESNMKLVFEFFSSFGLFQHHVFQLILFFLKHIATCQKGEF